MHELPELFRRLSRRFGHHFTGAALGFDLLPGSSAECACHDGKLLGDLAIAEDLDPG